MVEGITQAQKEVIDSFREADAPNIAISTKGYQQLEFDISVTSSSSEETSGKGGISIKVIDFGVKGSNVAAQTAVNKLKFSVFISVDEKNNFPVYK